ncbi:MAG: SIMPL domain-containing protein [Bacteroidota bacterium]
MMNKNFDVRNGMYRRNCSMAIIGILTLTLSSLAQTEKNDISHGFFELFEKVNISKPADIGTATLKINTEDASFETAILENERVREDLKNSIVKNGIDKENIKTANYSSIPVSGFFSGKTKKHKIQNRIDIIITNEKELAKVAKIVDANDKVEYVGIKFDLVNEDSLKAELRKKAFKNVKIRRKEIEDEFQVKLSLVGYKEMKVEDVQYFDREIKSKSMAYDMVLREEAAPVAAFNSLELETGILFTFKIVE